MKKKLINVLDVVLVALIYSALGLMVYYDIAFYGQY